MRPNQITYEIQQSLFIFLLSGVARCNSKCGDHGDQGNATNDKLNSSQFLEVTALLSELSLKDENCYSPEPGERGFITCKLFLLSVVPNKQAKSHFGLDYTLARDVIDRVTLRLSMIGPITFWTLHIMAQDFLACDFLAPDIWDGMTHRLIRIWPRTIWTFDVMDCDFLDQCILAQDNLEQKT